MHDFDIDHCVHVKDNMHMAVVGVSSHSFKRFDVVVCCEIVLGAFGVTVDVYHSNITGTGS